MSEGKAESARLLVQHGADVNLRDRDYSTPLQLAASSGSAELVELLIQHGADVNARDIGLRTPLHLALTSVSVKTLVQQHRADVNKQGSDFRMSFKGKVESARLLIRHEADVNVRDQDYLTPLQLAISSRSTEAVELLVQNGADANALDRMFESEEDSVGKGEIGEIRAR